MKTPLIPSCSFNVIECYLLYVLVEIFLFRSKKGVIFSWCIIYSVYTIVNFLTSLLIVFNRNFFVPYDLGPGQIFNVTFSSRILTDFVCERFNQALIFRPKNIANLQSDQLVV